MADYIKIDEFIKRNGLRMTAERTDSNPMMDAPARSMDHWKVYLRKGTRRMSLVFSQGHGFNGAQPEIASVVDTLGNDAAGYEAADGFEQWASDLGYDADSRRA